MVMDGAGAAGEFDAGMATAFRWRCRASERVAGGAGGGARCVFWDLG